PNSNIEGTVNGIVTSNVAGRGIGLLAQTAGGGNIDLEFGVEAELSGTAVGILGSAAGSGDVTLDLHGSADQTDLIAIDPSLSLVVPAGIAAITEDGHAMVTTHAGSEVNQIGSLVGIEGVGVLAMATGSGNASATANGEVNATGFGVASAALGSGDATTKIGG